MAACLSIFFSAVKDCICLYPVTEVFVSCYAGIFLQNILLFFLGYCKKDYFVLHVYL